MPLRTGVLLPALVAALLWAAPTAAQSFTWSELPASALNSRYYAAAEFDRLVADPVAIRQGQQQLYFDTRGQSFIRMEVCQITSTQACEPGSQGGHWTRLYDGPPAYGVVHWAGVPQTMGQRHNARLRYYTVGSTRVLDFEIVVVPAAHRIFADTDGNSMVMWQGTTAALDSPFLVVEGIDAENVNIQNHYYALAGDLLGRARSRGADVVMYDFRDGGRLMEVNGDKLKLAIQYLNTIRVGPRRMDLAGLSMGGVISRYALAHMEAQGVAHNVGRFVSVDAPQQGAVIDPEFLDWVYAPPPLLINTQDLSANVTSPAGKQLLVYNPYDQSSPTWHTTIYQYFNGINGDGYPHQTTENVGVSFGTPAPNPDTGRSEQRDERRSARSGHPPPIRTQGRNGSDCSYPPTTTHAFTSKPEGARPSPARCSRWRTRELPSTSSVASGQSERNGRPTPRSSRTRARWTSWAASASLTCQLMKHNRQHSITASHLRS